MRVTEAKLEDFRAVVEVPVSPDSVRRVFVDDFKERPCGAERKVDGSLFHEGCGRFLAESDTEAGMLKRFKLVESQITGGLRVSSVIAGMDIAPELVCWGSRE